MDLLYRLMQKLYRSRRGQYKSKNQAKLILNLTQSKSLKIISWTYERQVSYPHRIRFVRQNENI